MGSNTASSLRQPSQSSKTRRVEAALRESENKFKTLVENLSEGVDFCDPDEVFLYANSRLAQMTGYTQAEMLGRTTYELVVPPERREEIQRKIEGRMQGVAEIYQTEFMRKDGSRFWVEISAAPIREPDGKIVGSVAIITDITERRAAELERLKMERETVKLQRRLMQAQKMEAIGQLAAGIAHDLNNALGAVVGHLQLMRGGDPKFPEFKHSVEVALGGCERATSLIEQLLGFSRQGKYKLAEVDLRRVVGETIEFMGKVIGKEINIKISDVLFDTKVLADEAQLQQALLNLLINAKQAMPEGGTIAINFGEEEVKQASRFNHQASDGRYVFVSVKDTGIGIHSDHIDKIFEPFFTTKGRDSGTGLGLSMVYGIIQHHGGWIEVDSEIGVGSAFRVYLPELDEDSLRPFITTLERPTCGKGKIMVIDDEAPLVDLAQKFFEKAGLEIKGFTSAEDALKWYKTHAPEIDYIILDMKMPELDGAQCFRALRQIDSEARVILLSGYIQDQAVQDMLAEGAITFFQKPLRYPELVNWVAERLPQDQK